MKIEFDPQMLKPLVEQIVREVISQVKAGPGHDGNQLAYTEPDAAKLLGVKPHVLRDLRLRREIEASKVGRRFVYTQRSLLDFLDRNRCAGN